MHDIDDVSKLRMSLAQNDLLKVDLRRLMSFSSSSVNFDSNNPKVIEHTKPGFGKRLNPIGANFAINPRIFKSQEDWIFVVNSDAQEVQKYQFDNNSELNHMGNYKEFSKDDSSKHMRVADIHIDKNSLLVLAFDERKQNSPADKSKASYVVMRTSDFTKDDPNLETLHTLEVPWMEKPTLKFLFEMSTGSGTSAPVLLVFDKDLSAKQEANRSKSFGVFVLGSQSSGQAEVKAVRQFSVADTLLTSNALRNTRANLRNIVVANKKRTRVFFYLELVEGLKRSNGVFECKFGLATSLDKVSFSECKEFLSKPVQHFFLKEDYYVTISPDKAMRFCKTETHSCIEGQVQESWKIETLHIQDHFAVVVMKIESERFVFLNDFTSLSLLWTHDKHSSEVPTFVAHSFVGGHKRLYLVECPGKGIVPTDLTFNPFFEIQESHLEVNQATSLTLEGRTLLHYKVEKYLPEQVRNNNPNRRVDVVVHPQKEMFRTRLDLSGQHLIESDIENPRLRHFNQLAYTYEKKRQDKAYLMHGEWVFYKDSAEKQSCQFEKEGLEMVCLAEADSEKSYPRPIDLSKVERIHESGEHLLLFSQSAELIHFFDTRTRTMLDLKKPDSFKGGRKCKAYDYLIACVHKEELTAEKPKVSGEVVRLFMVDGEAQELVEVGRFRESLLEQLKEKVKADQSVVDGEVELSDFAFDSQLNSRLTMLYLFPQSGGSVAKRVFQFKFTHFLRTPNQCSLEFVERHRALEETEYVHIQSRMEVMDSRFVFVNHNNLLRVFVTDNQSQFRLDENESSAPLRLRVLSAHGLLIMVYQDSSSSDAKQHTLLVIRLTLDAGKRLVFRAHLPHFDPEKTHMGLWEHDTERVVLFFQDSTDSKTQVSSFVLFSNGPLLLSKDLKNDLSFGDTKRLLLNFDADPNFSSFQNVMVADNFVKVDRFSRELPLEIGKHFKLKGCVNNLTFNKEGSAVVLNRETVEGKQQTVDKVLNQIKESFKQPIMPGGESALTTFKSPIANKQDMAVVALEDKYVIQTDDSKLRYVVLDKLGQAKPVEVEFKNTNQKGCDALALSANSLLCFWTSGSIRRVTLKGLISSKDQEVIPLPEEVLSPSVWADNDNVLDLVYMSGDRQGIVMFRYERRSPNSPIVRTLIGKKELMVDDLQIGDFHLFMDPKYNRIVLLILNRRLNQLVMHTHSLSLNRGEVILKNTVCLDQLDRDVHRMRCIENSSGTGSRFLCYLFSPTHIHQTTLTQSVKDTLSPYKWDFVVRKSSYNSDYDPKDLSALAIRPLVFKNAVVVFDKAEKTLLNYDHRGDNDSSYANFLFRLNMADVIEAVEHSDDKVAVFFMDGLTLKVKFFELGTYSLRVAGLAGLLEGRLEFEVAYKFKDETMGLKIEFGQSKSAGEKITEKRNFWLVLLVTINVILGLSILVVLVLVLMLFRARKKLLMGPSHNVNETVLDETRADMSFI